jgi:hypothetical protein
MKWPAPCPEMSSAVLSLTLSTVLARLFHPVHRQVLRLLRGQATLYPPTQYASRQTVTVLPFAYLVFVAVTTAKESCLSPPWSGCRGGELQRVPVTAAGLPLIGKEGKRSAASS